MAHVSDAGLHLLKNLEGLRLTSYLDSANVWTIGYGHTGSEVHAGMMITEAEAERLLKQDLQRFEKAVENNLAKPATPGQFDAMVILAFNVGAGSFVGSTLLRLFNGGDVRGAFLQFTEWNKVGTQILQGLCRRRAAEQWRFAERDV
jgi:lysozyme